MRLFFNELSVSPIANNKFEAIERMSVFSKAIGAARQKGFRNIQSDYFTNQIELAPDYSLYNWLNDSDVLRDETALLFGLITPPYINEDDLEQYVETEFTFKDDEHEIQPTSCIGLAAAYLYDSPSISLGTSPVWSKVELTISVRTNAQPIEKIVYNISSVESFNDATLLAFIERITELDLTFTPLNPTEKKVTLFGDHHGKKELQKLSDKLINSPYVVEIRSTEYGGNRFIRKIFSDGVIEIALIDTDSRYALWVQTTGKNMKETKAIAKIIEEEFS